MREINPKEVVKKMALVILYVASSFYLLGWLAPELVSADSTPLAMLGGLLVIVWLLFSAWLGLRIANNKFNQENEEVQ